MVDDIKTMLVTNEFANGIFVFAHTQKLSPPQIMGKIKIEMPIFATIVNGNNETAARLNRMLATPANGTAKINRTKLFIRV